MILGVEIENFDVFDKDLAGILIEESIAIAKEKASGSDHTGDMFAKPGLPLSMDAAAQPSLITSWRNDRHPMKLVLPVLLRPTRALRLRSLL